jgi:hypothetical protein
LRAHKKVTGIGRMPVTWNFRQRSFLEFYFSRSASCRNWIGLTGLRQDPFHTTLYNDFLQTKHKQED